MTGPTRWRVVAVENGKVTIEDTEGPKDRRGQYPQSEFFGRHIDLGFQVGDWVGMRIYLVERPEKKTK